VVDKAWVWLKAEAKALTVPMDKEWEEEVVPEELVEAPVQVKVTAAVMTLTVLAGKEWEWVAVLGEQVVVLVRAQVKEAAMELTVRTD